jgi:hypothetical protein
MDKPNDAPACACYRPDPMDERDIPRCAECGYWPGEHGCVDFTAMVRAEIAKLERMDATTDLVNGLESNPRLMELDHQ